MRFVHRTQWWLVNLDLADQFTMEGLSFFDEHSRPCSQLDRRCRDVPSGSHGFTES